MLEVKITNDFKNLHTENGAIRDKLNIVEEEISNLLNRVSEFTQETEKYHSRLMETRDEFK